MNGSNRRNKTKRFEQAVARMRDGAIVGAALGVLLCLWIGVVYLIKGSEPFRRMNFSFLGAMDCYLLGMPTGGALAGC